MFLDLSSGAIDHVVWRNIRGISAEYCLHPRLFVSVILLLCLTPRKEARGKGKLDIVPPCVAIDIKNLAAEKKSGDKPRFHRLTIHLFQCHAAAGCHCLIKTAEPFDNECKSLQCLFKPKSSIPVNFRRQ